MSEHTKTPESLAAQPAEVAVPKLFVEHGDQIYSLGLRVCSSPEEAQDLVQETFLTAFDKWDQFEGRAKPSTWLYTIAKRICFRMHRRPAGAPEQLESFEELLPSREATVPRIDAEAPFDDRVRREAEEIVDRALGEMPIEFRVPLVLREIAELSIAEIAEVLGLNENTVKTRIHRARLKLRRALAQRFDQAPPPPPTQPQQVCFSLLTAKQEALDRGVELNVPEEEICERCRGVFATLDLAVDACRTIGRREMPERLREAVLSHAEGA